MAATPAAAARDLQRQQPQQNNGGDAAVAEAKAAALYSLAQPKAESLGESRDGRIPSEGPGMPASAAASFSSCA